ncbi:MAG TPA: hypothetical protein VM598_12070, partial [Bdellovibrionota bacterium]|nr:hypothetical protein [Bdellovibrionota bacterium]
MALPYRLESGKLGLDDFQKMLQELQRSYHEQIEQARGSDDGARMQILARELQSEISRLVGQFHSRLSNAQPGEVLQLFERKGAHARPEHLYDNTLCGLNLEMAVYDGDRDTLASLLRDPQ